MSRPYSYHPGFCSKKTLRRRGWTRRLMSRFLPTADLVTWNPEDGHGSAKNLYSLERIKQIEQTDDWRVARQLVVDEILKVRRAICDNIPRLPEYWEYAIGVEVPSIPRDHLIKFACDHFNNSRRQRRWHKRRLTPDDDQAILNRVVVNYLRHQLTDYDYHVDLLYQTGPNPKGHFFIRKQVLDAIAAIYPWLIEECERQQDQIPTEIRRNMKWVLASAGLWPMMSKPPVSQCRNGVNDVWRSGRDLPKTNGGLEGETNALATAVAAGLVPTPPSNLMFGVLF